MGRIARGVSLATLILVLACPATRAQDRSGQQTPTSQKPKEKPSTPTAPILPLSKSRDNGHTQAADQNRQQEQSNPSEQRRQPLSGAEQYTVSTMGQARSYFIPILQISQGGVTNGLNQFGTATFKSVTTLSGAFALNHIWKRYSFNANYSGSGFLYDQDLSLSSSAHSFALSQTVTGVRSTLLIADAASYLPEAAFGFQRFGGVNGYNAGYGGMFGVNSGNLNGMYIPNQSILTGASSRISNAVVGQYDYSLSPLSSVTFAGSYGLLRSPDSGFINSNDVIFGVGYNHSINRRDSLGVNYVGSIFQYDQADNNFTSHVVALLYGHQISKLLALRLGAGPQVNRFNSANGNTDVSWYGVASLYYTLPRTQVSAGYIHYTTAGAGVFVGADTDTLHVTLGRQITRLWSGGVSMGYSRNKNLKNIPGSPTLNTTFNSWYASANLQRPLGRHMGLFLSYNLQQQSSNSPLASFYTQNYFSIGFNWHPSTIDVTEETNQD